MKKIVVTLLAIILFVRVGQISSTYQAEALERELEAEEVVEVAKPITLGFTEPEAVTRLTELKLEPTDSSSAGQEAMDGKSDNSDAAAADLSGQDIGEAPEVCNLAWNDEFEKLSASEFTEWPAQSLLLFVADEEADFEKIDDTGFDWIILQAALAGDYTTGELAIEQRNRQIDRCGLKDQKFDFHTLYLISKLITAEVGCYVVPTEWRFKVGEVLVNRIYSPEFPTYIEDVLYAEGQYYSRDSVVFQTTIPNEDSVRCAYRLLNGERMWNDPAIVFHCDHEIGSGVAEILHNDVFGDIYFCYSYNMEVYENMDGSSDEPGQADESAGEQANDEPGLADESAGEQANDGLGEAWPT